MFDKILVMFNLFAAEIPDYWVNKNGGWCYCFYYDCSYKTRIFVKKSKDLAKSKIISQIKVIIHQIHSIAPINILKKSSSTAIIPGYRVISS